MTEQAGYVERVAAWLRQPIDWPEVFAPEYRTGFSTACENIANALLSGSWEAQDLTAEPGEAGYVEYGVRCPDGEVIFTDRTRNGADWKIGDLAHAPHGHMVGVRNCQGPHEVVQRTVSPWEVAAR